MKKTGTYPIFICLLSALFFVLSCKPEKNKVFYPPFNPKSPAHAIASWQSYMDNNAFEEAKRIGTSETISFLNYLSKTQEISPYPLEKNNSKIISVRCVNEVVHSLCVAKIQDLDLKELYLDTFFMVQKNDNWLIHIQDE